MQALCDRLGNPERSFRSLHVVGTNGKSSVTLMTAALLEDAGVHTGACISPHVRRWRERTRIGGAEIEGADFAAAMSEVAGAIDELEAELAGAERVTQFEAAIAASFVAFRRGGVAVAVVEAGLGGRLDATNVVRSEATALTSVGLDHTEWLGESIEEIAAEKLAVLEPGTTLITGRLPPTAAELARRHARKLGATLIELAEAEPGPGSISPDYLRANAELALVLAETCLGRGLDPDTARGVLSSLSLPGRLELIDEEPPLLLDAAHNPQGAAALCAALPGLVSERPVICCMSLLSDKDAEAIASALAPGIEALVATAAAPGAAIGRPGAEPADPVELAAIFERRGVGAEAVQDPEAAIRRTRELASERSGVALFAGSHYLLKHVWTGRQDPNCSR